jgi:hypothetical protein
MHDAPRSRQSGLEFPNIVVLGRESPVSDAGLNRSLGHRGRFPQQYPVVEWFRDQIVTTELERLATVGPDYRVGNVFLSEVGQRTSRCQLHFLVDMGRGHIEGAAKDKGKAKHIIDLIRVVRAARGHDDVGTYREGVLGQDLGVGVGHGENDRVFGHCLHHLLGHQTLDRDSGEDIGALHGVGQGARLGVDREAFLVFIHPLGASLVDHSLGVHHQEVLLFDTERNVKGGTRDTRCAGSREHHLDVLDLFAGHLERVDQSGTRNDCRTVLIVVEDRDVAALLEAFLDLETLGRSDVLEIDAAEGRREELAETDDLFRVFAVDLDVEDIDVGKALEEHTFALHHRFAGHWADVAETEDGGAVGNHSNQVPLVGVLINQLGVAGDLKARFGDPGCVGQRKVALSDARLGRYDLGFSVSLAGVVGESLFFRDLLHGSSPRFNRCRVKSPQGRFHERGT